jgi:hypothetical protein
MELKQINQSQDDWKVAMQLLEEITHKVKNYNQENKMEEEKNGRENRTLA